MATDGSDEVRVEKSADGHVWTVILSRRERRNAVDRPTAARLAAAFRDFDGDEDARVAVLWGEHGTFCSGADLKAIATGNGNEVLPVGEADGPMGPTRMSLSKPVIAAISGFAVAGGIELAAWCDLRVVEEDATMGVFCRRWGVPLIDGGTVRLPRLIGESRAMDLILTGRPVGAEEAERIGLANRVVPHGAARREAEALAAQIAKFPQLCMKQDRMSAREQFAAGSEVAALANEYEKGVVSLSEAAMGAARFAGGEGRHGDFGGSGGGGGDADAGSGSGSGSGSADPFDAVVFDLGGVIVGSPFVAIRRYEQELKLPHNAINRVIAKAGQGGAFQKLERGELDVGDFVEPFTRELEAQGVAGVDAGRFVRMIADELQPRPLMLEALHTLKAAGIKTGVLTNNFRHAGITAMLSEVKETVDCVVESAVEGIRKPDPAIYELMSRRLGVPPARMVYLDDIGANLKPARALGMHTIKVAIEDHTGASALRELQALLPRVALRLVRHARL